MMEWLFQVWVAFSIVNLVVLLSLILSGNWSVQWYGWLVAIITGPVGSVLLTLTIVRNT